MTDKERKLFVKFAKTRISELEAEITKLKRDKEHLEQEVKRANDIINRHLYPRIDESECDHYNL